MHERRDLYLLWARHPQAARPGPLPYSLGPAAERRHDCPRRPGLLARLRRSMARREQAPAALVGEGQRDELDIHGYLNLEFAVDDEHSHTGNWGR